MVIIPFPPSLEASLCFVGLRRPAASMNSMVKEDGHFFAIAIDPYQNRFSSPRQHASPSFPSLLCFALSFHVMHFLTALASNPRSIGTRMQGAFSFQAQLLSSNASHH